jgi:hypothetical protein
MQPNGFRGRHVIHFCEIVGCYAQMFDNLVECELTYSVFLALCVGEK